MIDNQKYPNTRESIILLIGITLTLVHLMSLYMCLGVVIDLTIEYVKIGEDALQLSEQQVRFLIVMSLFHVPALIFWIIVGIIKIKNK